MNVPNIKYNYKKAFDETGRKYEEDALTFMAKNTSGYAYAFQLMGYLAWKSAADIVTVKTVKALMDEYKMLLYRNAYGAICDAFCIFIFICITSLYHPMKCTFLG